MSLWVLWTAFRCGAVVFASLSVSSLVIRLLCGTVVKGDERDIIVLSCVRANDQGSLGFITRKDRLNVALTRACHFLFAFGNLDWLECGISRGEFFHKWTGDIRSNWTVAEVPPVAEFGPHHPVFQQVPESPRAAATATA